jgi:hypothetical protein
MFMQCSLNVLALEDSMSDEAEGPIHLEVDESTGDRFLVYGGEKGLRIDIRFEGETLWMTQAQIAELFGRDVANVSRHIANILEEGELAEGSNLRKTQLAHSTKPVTLYSLDMVISVGYRVSSAQATVFRRWATGILVQYARKGFVVDSVRLKQPDNSDRIAELREIIRDIRSDEANVFRELKKICAMCQDYDPVSDTALTFFQHTQAKLIYAITSHTPAEVISSRANRRAENMGMQTWPNENIRKSDVTVSKNYLVEAELKELNRLTTILLDIFEDQMDVGRLVVMADATRLLGDQLKGLGRAVLRDGGRVSKRVADDMASAEFLAWSEAQKIARRQEADRLIAELGAKAKSLPKR